jgi:hypothetical protein
MRSSAGIKKDPEYMLIKSLTKDMKQLLIEIGLEGKYNRLIYLTKRLELSKLLKRKELFIYNYEQTYSGLCRRDILKYPITYGKYRSLLLTELGISLQSVLINIIYKKFNLTTNLKKGIII